MGENVAKKAGSPETKFETVLEDSQESKYHDWRNKIGYTTEAGMAVDESGTGRDYDLRGFFDKYGPADIVKGQHFTDEFKKPNHETFSNESMYAKYAPNKAGSWDGETYSPNIMWPLMGTLKTEGGYVVDDGMPTNYGVTQGAYNAYLNKNKMPAEDVKNLTFNKVKNFYQSEYWDAPKINEIKDPTLRAVTFDFAVNSGPNTAIEVLQKIVGVKPDGSMGPKTLKAIDRYSKKNGSDMLYTALMQARVDYYKDLVVRKPEKKKNEEGWYNRLSKLSEYYSQ